MESLAYLSLSTRALAMARTHFRWKIHPCVRHSAAPAQSSMPLVMNCPLSALVFFPPSLRCTGLKGSFWRMLVAAGQELELSGSLGARSNFHLPRWENYRVTCAQS